MPDADSRPLVMHVMYRFDTGGLENGVVNLINHMPSGAYRHAVVALTEVTAFRHRIQRSDVEFISLHKPPGHGIWQYPALYKLFRKMKPAIVHTRNLAALEAMVPAWAARVPVRIHGEHGWDIGDLHGANNTYRRLRRLYSPFVSHYLALSNETAGYLKNRVGIPGHKVTQVYNGVDAARFHPVGEVPDAIPGCPFSPAEHWIVGTVGRMQAVKDQPTLVRAFIRALERAPELRHHMRLAMVGDGPLRAESLRLLEAAGVLDLAWLPGERSDVPAVMRGLNCFVLPSLAEGISNTILEAMASGLPVIATDVGGNADLVANGRSGLIVPSADAEAMAREIVRLARAPASAAEMGREGRRLVEHRFSMQAMVEAYQGCYDTQLNSHLRH